MCSKRFIVLVLIFVFPSFLWADAIVNPGFEFAVEGTDFDTPADWQYENYAAVVNNFESQGPNWEIDPQTGLNPFEGDSFVVLSNGNMTPETSYAKIWQEIIISAGQAISGAYFFGTTDWEPYHDYGTIKLIAPSGSGIADIELVNISVNDVGTYSSTTGWLTFQSELFTSATAGTYTLECAVYDDIDYMFSSYLAVDGLAIIPEPASIMLFIVGVFISARQKSKRS